MCGSIKLWITIFNILFFQKCFDIVENLQNLSVAYFINSVRQRDTYSKLKSPAGVKLYELITCNLRGHRVQFNKRNFQQTIVKATLKVIEKYVTYKLFVTANSVLSCITMSKVLGDSSVSVL